jgi:hypothetical protein
VPVVVVEILEGSIRNIRAYPLKPESYSIRVARGESAPVVYVEGFDERGVLYGVGKLLRSLRMTKLRVEVPGHLEFASSPKYPLRGHQLGYRPKTNSYDGWTVPLWDQYIRELALFGCNFIELIPPRSDDDDDSPHFTLPKKEMMIEMSRICDEYGLDVWVWYPAMERDYSDAATVEREIAAWAEIFKVLPRVDAVFVPGGDPGHTEPKYMMALLEKQTHNLRQYHPHGQMWMSPQSFTQAWFDEFLDILKSEPAWLAGVVFGPQNRLDLPTLRKLVPERYPIRLYPDITHTIECQFPVPDWDVAFSLTEGREPINPRPEAYANVVRRYLPYSSGFGSYSEGCNDDVNKFVERAGVGSRDESHRCTARLWALVCQPSLRRGFCPRPAGAGESVGGAAACQRRSGSHSDALPDHGARCDSRRAAELALSASALPSLLRCLCAPPADL